MLDYACELLWTKLFTWWEVTAMLCQHYNLRWDEAVYVMDQIGV
jgi:hypothetical protein